MSSAGDENDLDIELVLLRKLDVTSDSVQVRCRIDFDYLDTVNMFRSEDLGRHLIKPCVK